MKRATLIILGGFAGAGKTTVAKRISAEYRLPLISTDELNDAIRKTFDFDFHQASPHAHDIAWSQVRSYIRNNATVILDTNMCRERTWQNVDDVRNEFPELTIIPIILECSLETHKKRISHRGETQPDHLNLGGDAIEDVLSKYEFITSLNRPDLIRISAEGSEDNVYRDVIERLGQDLLK